MKKGLILFIVVFLTLIFVGFENIVSANELSVSTYDNQFGSEFNNAAMQLIELVENSSLEESEEKLENIGLLILGILMLVFTTFFVFVPKNIVRMKIMMNTIIPMHEEPYEPTSLNVALIYTGYLIIFLVSIILIVLSISGLSK